MYHLYRDIMPVDIIKELESLRLSCNQMNEKRSVVDMINNLIEKCKSNSVFDGNDGYVLYCKED